jgi:predicted nucleic acid-binding Zn ribbon protein
LPTYNYLCENKKHGEFVFSVKHGINDKPKVPCPKCGKKCERTWLGMTFSFYFPGNGLAHDRIGAKRDMNLYHLMKDDPYKGHRQPGEKQHLADTLRRGGKHQKNPKTFGVSGLKKG